jgi:hypothetical protein
MTTSAPFLARGCGSQYRLCIDLGKVTVTQLSTSPFNPAFQAIQDDIHPTHDFSETEGLANVGRCIEILR